MKRITRTTSNNVVNLTADRNRRDVQRKLWEGEYVEAEWTDSRDDTTSYRTHTHFEGVKSASSASTFGSTGAYVARKASQTVLGAIEIASIPAIVFGLGSSSLLLLSCGAFGYLTATVTRRRIEREMQMEREVLDAELKFNAARHDAELKARARESVRTSSSRNDGNARQSEWYH